MSCESENMVAMQLFRSELKALIGDISKVDEKVLTRALNEGVAFAKRQTPVGRHPNPVTFTVKSGPDVGRAVSFRVSNPGVGGLLRKSWNKTGLKRNGKDLEGKIFNNAKYALFWNNGHRIVLRKNGPTKGWAKGTFLMEKTRDHVEGRLPALFEKEIREVKKRNDC